ncbi:carboxylating nicotinate-nucleotide diphosphorylase [Algivirga pacifica]|uniref:nicotinate-nucleotide diphosphorylase (carboxylating) n=1 Tax=Algivirga pacifica TaxID=1162670 RepID=A0ABP9D540_9BACT
MKPEYLTEEAVNQFIDLALKEDVGDGDHSSLASVPANKVEKARLIIKDSGILAGIEMAEKILHRVDPSVQVNILIEDGTEVKYGDIAMLVEGSAQSILTAERLLLNCMQRMSGIATHTRKLTNLLEGTGAALLDTRKTTPNFRIMEKWAVFIGGGKNHRFGLYDMIMLKDNHIDYAGGITAAVQDTLRYLEETGRSLPIEVETRNLDEVKEALSVDGISRIMLDNMSTEEMKDAVQLINGKVETEASGGIHEGNIAEVAKCGVDYISVGALTHSSRSLDISLKAY